MSVKVSMSVNGKAVGAEIEERTLLVSFGISARTCRQVAREADELGAPVSLLEILSLYPVPRAAIKAALAGIGRAVLVEENGPGLYARDLLPLMGGVDVRQVNGVGAMIPPEAIREEILS